MKVLTVTPHTKHTLNTSSFYHFTDLLIMFSSWEITGDKLFVLHHLAALYAYSYVLVGVMFTDD